MSETIGWLVFIAVVSFGITSCNNSEWWQSGERARAATDAANAKPHVIRSADGCKVYAFHAGGADHFFTRCENTTMTQRKWTEGCGKNCTKHLTEEITTENAK